ncbi:hypothetical protein B0I35DRAFT_464649 [Stachybotrys elegans]|uniref:CBM-cenC domain-containing protein n=1 Tax=Stachybotrys elegans TaxID=80388 RepID=A0A8K0SGT0_9HYPO|nr:hypothetical protein B0I35DRAFT_464649 [Stachybotrys elegans]
MMFKSTAAACLSLLAFLDVASAAAIAVIEPRACPANNLLRGLKDKRYSAAAAPYYGFHARQEEEEEENLTRLTDVQTVTDVIPNTSTVRLTQTRTSYYTVQGYTRATVTQPGATTVASYAGYVEVRVTTERVWTAYTSTTTFTTTLGKTDEVVIPTGLANIVSKYPAASVTQACDCLELPPGTQTKTVGQETATVTSSAGVQTLTLRPRVISTVTDMTTIYPYQSTVSTPTTYTETDYSYTATRTTSLVMTATRTECAYTQSPVINPSFGDGETAWDKLQFGDWSTTVQADNTTSRNNDGTGAYKVEFRHLGTFLGIRQAIEDLCPTTWYTMTMWIKPSQVSGSCRTMFSTGNGYARGSSPIEAGWNKYTANVYSGPMNYEMTSLFAVDCGYEGNVRTFWIDDVDVQRMNPQPPAPY